MMVNDVRIAMALAVGRTGDRLLRWTAEVQPAFTPECVYVSGENES